jgi:hypothetical protein
MNGRSVIIMAILLVEAALAAPRSFAAGTTSFESLLVGTGARAQGVGGAYTALTDDVNSIYWNQAGLCLVTEPQVTFMYNALIEGMGYSCLALGIHKRNGNRHWPGESPS